MDIPALKPFLKPTPTPKEIEKPPSLLQPIPKSM
jgi:hypothetical protein